MTSVTRSSSGLEEETLTVLRSFSRRIFSWVCRKQRHFNKVISSSDIKCANKRKKKKQEEEGRSVLMTAASHVSTGSAGFSGFFYLQPLAEHGEKQNSCSALTFYR